MINREEQALKRQGRTSRRTTALRQDGGPLRRGTGTFTSVAETQWDWVGTSGKESTWVRDGEMAGNSLVIQNLPDKAVFLFHLQNFYC